MGANPAPLRAGDLAVWRPGVWWRDRVLARQRVLFPEGMVRSAFDRLPLLDGFGDQERRRLCDLALLFLKKKSLEGAAGLELDSEMRLVIALQACLPVLNLGLDWYRGWVSVIVYPAEFVPEREWVDEAGVVWKSRAPLSGEAWLRGPVILSWDDVERGLVLDGFNVVIHELAHKLDMCNGDANGHPPLHSDMQRELWTRVFEQAFENFRRRAEATDDLAIDPYAAESPAEFFAVVTEAFFEIPGVLHTEYPGVYGQLSAFFRQDPLRRLPEAWDD